MRKPNTSQNPVASVLETHQEKIVYSLLSEHINKIPDTQPNLDAMQTKLTQRVVDSIAKHAGLQTVRSRDGLWQKLASGIRYKLLSRTPTGNSVLIELAPGASLPLHRHSHLEEGIVLSGSLQLDDLVLKEFDYHVSPAGSHHGKIWSDKGGMAFLRGSSVGETFSMVKELLGGLMPKNRLVSTSIKASENEWHEVHKGVFRKVMLNDGEFVSQFYRVEPDTKIEAHGHAQDEECMMLSGELFLGDILLQAGDYQLAPKGTQHLEGYTDTGALFYVRAAVN